MYEINYGLLANIFYESGVTFTKIEKSTNMSRSTIYNIITGKTNPSYQAAYLISEALDLTQEEILAIYFPHAKSEKELKCESITY